MLSRLSQMKSQKSMVYLKLKRSQLADHLLLQENRSTRYGHDGLEIKGSMTCLGKEVSDQGKWQLTVSSYQVAQRKHSQQTTYLLLLNTFKSQEVFLEHDTILLQHTLSLQAYFLNNS